MIFLFLLTYDQLFSSGDVRPVITGIRMKIQFTYHINDRGGMCLKRMSDARDIEQFFFRTVIHIFVKIIVTYHREVSRILQALFFENLSQRDVAQRLDISQMTVSRIERQALERLRERMTEQE